MSPPHQVCLNNIKLASNCEIQPHLEPIYWSRSNSFGHTLSLKFDISRSSLEKCKAREGGQKKCEFGQGRRKGENRKFGLSLTLSRALLWKIKVFLLLLLPVDIFCYMLLHSRSCWGEIVVATRSKISKD